MHQPTEAAAAAGPPPLTPVAPWWHTTLVVLLLIGGSVLNARQAHHAALSEHHVARYLTRMIAEWILFLLVWWGFGLPRVPLASLLGFRRGLRAWDEDYAAAAVFWVLALMVL